MPTPLLTLQDHLTRLTLAPELGASLVNWSRLSDGWPLLRHSDAQALDAGTPRRLACFALVPWSNRIGGGGFACPDGWQTLTANTSYEPLPIHGSAWQQAWQVQEATTSSAILQLDSEQPFPYHAQLHVNLSDGQLSLELQVTHQGPQPRWYGLGFHPYFTRTAHTQLEAPAKQVWLCDSDKLSDHKSELPAHWNFAQAAPLPAETMDNALTQWPGTARIIQADAGYQLRCTATGSDFYLLFCPAEQNFFCFEPVSHPVNAHHLPGRPGLYLLEQGQSCKLRFTLHYQPLAG